MHLQASHVARVTTLPQRPPGDPAAMASTGRFAQVYDLAAERERRTPPAAALAAIEEAARAWEELDAAGLQVRFDLSSGVSAQLRDSDGSLVRALSLHEIIDPSGLLPPDAA